MALNIFCHTNYSGFRMKKAEADSMKLISIGAIKQREGGGR